MRIAMHRGVMAGLLVGAVVASWAGPAAAEERDSTACKGKEADEVIAACTSILGRGGREPARNRANAYNNRGIAYLRKNDYDHAIRDIAEAIALQPKDPGRCRDGRISISSPSDGAPDLPERSRRTRTSGGTLTVSASKSSRNGNVPPVANIYPVRR